ncbi:hypothetical protein PVAP13_9KG175600 [Panicum virgatum]|uniref:Uncharacterized protein n=1 Tax=Panicum virgatum TaxID=38727 RepID=A0A8T0NKS3_PANVG|nr:hypothetical protein PVAP13_9KG175600 [Panicum virgatum]
MILSSKGEAGTGFVRWCRGLASALFRHLCSVDALLVGGASKSHAGWCFHRFRHSPSRIPPLGWRWMVVRGARRSCRCHHQLQGRSSCPVSCGLCTLRRL